MDLPFLQAHYAAKHGVDGLVALDDAVRSSVFVKDYGDHLLFVAHLFDEFVEKPGTGTKERRMDEVGGIDKIFYDGVFFNGAPVVRERRDLQDADYAVDAASVDGKEIDAGALGQGDRLEKIFLLAYGRHLRSGSPDVHRLHRSEGADGVDHVRFVHFQRALLLARHQSREIRFPRETVGFF